MAPAPLLWNRKLIGWSEHDTSLKCSYQAGPTELFNACHVLSGQFSTKTVDNLTLRGAVNSLLQKQNPQMHAD